MINKAILLVGGKGTRLAELTKNTPKPMLKVAGAPVTQHQIARAQAAGITEIVLATSYLAEVFEPYFGDGSKFGISIKYAIEEQPLGTGGAIANAAKCLKLAGDESVFIFNGDVLSGHDLKAQAEFHESKGADVTLHLVRVEDARAYGCVPLDVDGKVLEFLEKMDQPKVNTINAGCYIFNKSAIEQINPDAIVSVERQTFPDLLARKGALYGYIDDSYWIDMGTPESYIKASRDLILNSEISPATRGVRGGALIASDAGIDATAVISDGSVIESGAVIGARCQIKGSIVSTGVSIGADSIIDNCYIAPNVSIASNEKIFAKIISN
ncbi:MAG: NDP-sugar synthase [Actinobacteria bacterium]|nr:NDP-sugar synthase [Actinomycetota bacterium]